MSSNLAEHLASLTRLQDSLNATVSDPRNHALRLKRHGLLVRTKLKDFALARASHKKLSTGKPRFVRVSEKFVDRMEAKCRALIGAEVDRLPSNGRTIR